MGKGEKMEIDDNLVKLASFGTAGISILAVFITGVIIYKLPNDVSKQKSSLLKFFIVSCFVFVILSTGTGVLNAMFNKEKIVEKEQVISKADSLYNNEKTKWLGFRDEIDTKLNSLQSELNKPTINKTELNESILKLGEQTKKMDFRKSLITTNVTR